jgi:eukaryotic-like serine/threonine-protein kinase
MNGAEHQASCNDIQLDVLLFGDEASAEFQRSAEHVETCFECQERLSKCAADDGDWINVKTMLRRNRTDREPRLPGSASDFASHPEASQSPVQLDFLSPPSHPEMLGRLGRYEIEQIIGRGGMGVVFKGFDTQLHRVVAIKVLAPHLAHSGPARQRFDREARAAASIVHEHVVAIHDVKSDDAAPYLVMQFVAGQSLQERVAQEGPLSPGEILRIGMQAAAGLAAAHAQGVIHRDVKPANILLENGVDRALLTDFGLARAADDATLTHSGIIAGTPHYMAPEQARGRPADAHSDLFSLGAVLYFMATGHPPFRADQAMAILNRICHDQHRNVQEINPSIPNDLADAIDRLLEKKPARRFASAEEAQQTLSRALAAIQKPSPSPARRWFRKLSRRRRVPLVFAACFSATLVIGGGWVIYHWTHPGSTVVNGDTATTQSAPVDNAVAATFLSDQEAFSRQLSQVQQSLSEMERDPRRGISAIQGADHFWRAEFRSAETEVSNLERSWASGPDNNFSQPSIGEKR